MTYIKPLRGHNLYDEASETSHNFRSRFT